MRRGLCPDCLYPWSECDCPPEDEEAPVPRFTAARVTDEMVAALEDQVLEAAADSRRGTAARRIDHVPCPKCGAEARLRYGDDASGMTLAGIIRAALEGALAACPYHGKPVLVGAEDEA